MKHLTTCIFLFLVFCVKLLPAQGWHVDVTAAGYEGKEIYLAYYLGSSQYIQDTSSIEGDHFVFSGKDTLQPGVYMVVFPPENQFFQLLIGVNENKISVKVRMEDVQHPDQVKGSRETELFYEYIEFLKTRKPQADSLRKMIAATEDATLKVKLEKELKMLNDEVHGYQQSIVDKHEETLTALLIQANMEIETPDFEGTDEEKQLQLYHYVKAHYFDHVPLEDPRLLRTPVLQQKLDYYVNKLTPQTPDSINQSLDYILDKFGSQSEAFKIYLVHFLNAYAKSKIVGMDAVYVHLVENYYAKGYATWADSAQLDKIIKNAETLKPLLIGKIAPDLLLLSRNNTPIRLHNIDAAYTVLFFWDPDCGHCKKSMPQVIEFYRTYKPKGVEILGVCTKLQDEVSKCWEYIDEHEGMGEWMHAVDPYLRSRFKQIYDVKTTPQIYILDKDKKIVMKKIGAEQLPEVMDRLLENGS